VQPHRCYNENTISDTGHHADADGLKGLTGGCIFIFRWERKDAKEKAQTTKDAQDAIPPPRGRKLRQNTFSEVQLEQAEKAHQ